MKISVTDLMCRKFPRTWLQIVTFSYFNIKRKYLIYDLDKSEIGSDRD